ncbi:hypothetical protein J4Q44_G00221490 [Coregonus suidteri]|uniref:Sm domain-containing protein n=1 Tax=Coregonus suidteri TaxID=861788 RepID=A0AAN8LNE5_9TELE
MFKVPIQCYYQACGLLPRLSLQKEGNLLSPQDLLLAVLHTNDEVLAEVCSWDLLPLPDQYKKACHSMTVEENKHVVRLCEVQDGSPSVSVCDLSLTPSSLSPLLHALKLQVRLTQLSGNHFHDDLFPELVAAATVAATCRLIVNLSNLLSAVVGLGWRGRSGVIVVGYCGALCPAAIAGGREASGVLKGFDPLLNLILDSTIEYLRDPDDQFKLTEDTRQLGLVVCRGTSVVLICPQDGMEAIPNPFIQQQDG